MASLTRCARRRRLTETRLPHPDLADQLAARRTAPPVARSPVTAWSDSAQRHLASYGHLQALPSPPRSDPHDRPSLEERTSQRADRREPDADARANDGRRATRRARRRLGRSGRHGGRAGGDDGRRTGGGCDGRRRGGTGGDDGRRGAPNGGGGRRARAGRRRRVALGARRGDLGEPRRDVAGSRGGLKDARCVSRLLFLRGPGGPAGQKRQGGWERGLGRVEDARREAALVQADLDGLDKGVVAGARRVGAGAGGRGGAGRGRRPRRGGQGRASGKGLRTASTTDKSVTPLQLSSSDAAQVSWFSVYLGPGRRTGQRVRSVQGRAGAGNEDEGGPWACGGTGLTRR